MAFAGKRKIEKYNDGIETIDATIATALTIAVATDTCIVVTGQLTLRDKTNNKIANYTISSVAKNVAGTVTQFGVTLESWASGGDAGLYTVANPSWDVSTTNIRLRVTGIAATNIDWYWDLIKQEV